MSPRRLVSLLSPRRSLAFIVPEGRWYSIVVLSPLCCLLPLCCCLMSRLCFHLFFSETNMFFLRLHQLTVAASSRGERRATGRSPHMKMQQCGTEQDGTRRSPRPVGGDDKQVALFVAVCPHRCHCGRQRQRRLHYCSRSRCHRHCVRSVCALSFRFALCSRRCRHRCRRLLAGFGSLF